MSTKTPAEVGEARQMRAFQIDRSWFEDYWYEAEPAETSSRTCLAALASLTAAIGWLRRLIAERLTEHAPVSEP